jgi:hypothetical protein
LRSRTTEAFRESLDRLDAAIRRRARAAFARFQVDPRHPGLRFKKVHPERPIYSVRISRNHRAVGLVTGDEILWFFIGDHEEYEDLLRSL